MIAPYDYHAPSALGEALELLGRYGEDAHAMAGGTSLVLLMSQGLVRPGHVVGLRGIAALRGIERDGGTLVLGACATHRDAERSPLVRAHCPALADAFGETTARRTALLWIASPMVLIMSASQMNHVAAMTFTPLRTACASSQHCASRAAYAAGATLVPPAEVKQKGLRILLDPAYRGKTIWTDPRDAGPGQLFAVFHARCTVTTEVSSASAISSACFISRLAADTSPRCSRNVSSGFPNLPA